MGHPQCLKVGLKVAKMHKEEEDYGNTQLAYKAALRFEPSPRC
jgi:hypothetical protein